MTTKIIKKYISKLDITDPANQTLSLNLGARHLSLNLRPAILSVFALGLFVSMERSLSLLSRLSSAWISLLRGSDLTRRVPAKAPNWAVVADATSRLGSAFATRLAQSGYSIVAISAEHGKLDQLKASLTLNYQVEVRPFYLYEGDLKDSEKLFHKLWDFFCSLEVRVFVNYESSIVRDSLSKDHVDLVDISLKDCWLSVQRHVMMNVIYNKLALAYSEKVSHKITVINISNTVVGCQGLRGKELFFAYMNFVRSLNRALRWTYQSGSFRRRRKNLDYRLVETCLGEEDERYSDQMFRQYAYDVLRRVGYERETVGSLSMWFAKMWRKHFAGNQ
jgi:hypothetical protein